MQGIPRFYSTFGGQEENPNAKIQGSKQSQMPKLK
jgi:hypothetical protein